ncbi:hypothetical protein RJ55_07281 [Drechmeria coniospora]|nr:hypothetical protein RJ55_07281 [Drechmeria coniospora]
MGGEGRVTSPTEWTCNGEHERSSTCTIIRAPNVYHARWPSHGIRSARKRMTKCRQHAFQPFQLWLTASVQPRLSNRPRETKETRSHRTLWKRPVLLEAVDAHEVPRRRKHARRVGSELMAITAATYPSPHAADCVCPRDGRRWTQVRSKSAARSDSLLLPCASEEERSPAFVAHVTPHLACPTVSPPAGHCSLLPRPRDHSERTPTTVVAAKSRFGLGPPSHKVMNRQPCDPCRPEGAGVAALGCAYLEAIDALPGTTLEGGGEDDSRSFVAYD